MTKKRWTEEEKGVLQGAVDNGMEFLLELALPHRTESQIQYALRKERAIRNHQCYRCRQPLSEEEEPGQTCRKCKRKLSRLPSRRLEKGPPSEFVFLHEKGPPQPLSDPPRKEGIHIISKGEKKGLHVCVISAEKEDVVVRTIGLRSVEITMRVPRDSVVEDSKERNELSHFLGGLDLLEEFSPKWEKKKQNYLSECVGKGICYICQSPCHGVNLECRSCLDLLLGPCSRIPEDRKGGRKLLLEKGLCVTCGIRPIDKEISIVRCQGCVGRTRSTTQKAFLRRCLPSLKKKTFSPLRWLRGGYWERRPFLENYSGVKVVDVFGGSGHLSALASNYGAKELLYNDIHPLTCAYVRAIRDHGMEPLVRRMKRLLKMSPKEVLQHYKDLLDSRGEGVSDAFQAAVLIVVAFSNVNKPCLRNKEIREVRMPGASSLRKNGRDFRRRLGDIRVLNKDFAEVLRQYQEDPACLFLIDPPFPVRGKEIYEFHIEGRYRELINLLNECAGNYIGTVSANAISLEQIHKARHHCWFLGPKGGEIVFSSEVQEGKPLRIEDFPHLNLDA